MRLSNVPWCNFGGETLTWMRSDHILRAIAAEIQVMTSLPVVDLKILGVQENVQSLEGDLFLIKSHHCYKSTRSLVGM